MKACRGTIREAVSFVNFVYFVYLVRTHISLKFNLQKEISHKVHKAHRVAGDTTPLRILLTEMGFEDLPALQEVAAAGDQN